jgi:hypothetical protein
MPQRRWAEHAHALLGLAFDLRGRETQARVRQKYREDSLFPHAARSTGPHARRRPKLVKQDLVTGFERLEARKHAGKSYRLHKNLRSLMVSR